MPHCTTRYQPYELMFGHKAPTTCDVWLRLADYNDNYLQSKCELVNWQHELIFAANRSASKRIKQSAEKSVSWAGGKTPNIPIGNLVLLCDHPEDWNKIQDNYKSKLFVMESKHQVPNANNIKPLSGKGPMCMVNWWQLFDLQKSQRENLLDQAPDTNLPVMLAKKTPKNTTPKVSHLYVIWSKTRMNSTLQPSSEDETQVNSTVLESSSKDEESSGVIGSLFNHLTTKLWW